MRILMIVCLAVCGCSSYAQRLTGIHFFQGSWQQLLDSAKQSRQPIFVDVYTDWCGPCKRMEKEIFIQPAVSQYYQGHFLCYRLNAEKGEGPQLAKAFGVRAYPTWLYLDPDGMLRSHRTDYMPAEAFIEMGKSALGQDSISAQLAVLHTRFASGERDTLFLRHYLRIRSSLQLDNAGLLDIYIQQLSHTTPTPASIRGLLPYCGRTWSNAIPFIADHLSLFSPAEQKELANALFSNVLYYCWGYAIKQQQRDTALLALTVEEKLYRWLDTAQQLTADHAAIFHGKTFRQASALKAAGYRLAGRQMKIDTLSARVKDAELYAKVMAPFRAGQQDSTTIPAEELKLAARQYSGKAAALLYEVAEAFLSVLPAGDPALADARRWAIRADQLAGNEHTRALVERFGSTRH